MPEVITLDEAKARGLNWYTGAACRVGHTKRYVNSRGCVECARTRGAAENKVRKSKPIKAAPVVEAAPAVYEPEKSLHRDPGTRVSQARIDACIDRIYGGAPRLGVAALAESVAA